MSRTRGTLFAALPLLVGALAGCSTAADDAAAETKSESQIAADAQAWDLANANCLREAGVDIGDPSGDGGGMAISRGDGLDMDALLAASETCRESTTDELGERPVTASEKKSQDEFDARLRESAECVREAGYDVTDQLDGAGGTATMDDVLAGVLEECGAFGSMPTTVTR